MQHIHTSGTRGILKQSLGIILTCDVTQDQLRLQNRNRRFNISAKPGLEAVLAPLGDNSLCVRTVKSH